jgi:predicted nuclease with TOPRIM domain
MENETDIKLESLTEDELKAILKERDEAKSLVKQKEEGLNNVVEELKEMRQKKAELEEKLKQGADGQPSVEEVVANKLREAETLKQAEERKIAHQRAKEKFLAEHKEFLPENDTSGIRMAALEKKLSKFNLAGASSEDDALEIYNDALGLLSEKGSGSGFSGGTPPPASGGSSRYEGGGSLTAKELGVIQRLGWTREKYLETKAKHPQLVSDLFNQ